MSMESDWKFYGVKKGNKFLLKYEKQKASWIASPDEAWTTHSKESAMFFANVTHAQVIEIMMTIRSIK